VGKISTRIPGIQLEVESLLVLINPSADTTPLGALLQAERWTEKKDYLGRILARMEGAEIEESCVEIQEAFHFRNVACLVK